MKVLKKFNLCSAGIRLGWCGISGTSKALIGNWFLLPAVFIPSTVPFLVSEYAQIKFSYANVTLLIKLLLYGSLKFKHGSIEIARPFRKQLFTQTVVTISYDNIITVHRMWGLTSSQARLVHIIANVNQRCPGLLNGVSYLGYQFTITSCNI